MTIHKIEKFFNTAGPGKEGLNYMLDPLRRINYDEIATLIDQQRYFVLHAPRQTGKTTSLLAMADKINGEGRYYCVYVNVETAQTARNDVARGMNTILSRLENAIKRFLDRSISDVKSIREKNSGDSLLIDALERFCGDLDKSLVLFIDEIDALVGDTLVSVLRQLRDAYVVRPRFAPISVILCGVRDIRDYRIHRSDGEIITGGSCFNVT
ncbi:MAG: ATP-binding protein, partial [Synergistaceae bacterium]|nr:ATP-binding protein [Synergistaceae bacterium]